MFESFFKNLKYFLVFFVSMFFVFFILRAQLFLANPSWFSARSIESILDIFLVGARFDLAACAWMALSTTLFWFLWIFIRSYWFFLVFVFVTRAFVIAVLLFSFVDNLLIPYTGVRFDPKSLNFSVQDFRFQIFQLLGQYWFYFLLFFLVLFFLWGTLSKFFDSLHKSTLVQNQSKIRNLYNPFFTFFLIFTIEILCIRGGFQVKPLSITHAYSLGSAQDAVIALNSFYVLLNSINKDEIPRPSGFPNVSVAQEILNGASLEVPKKSLVESKGVLKNSNVIIFILESFSCEFSKFCSKSDLGYTPFLDAIASRGVAFEYAFANGRRSIDAVSSIFSSLPSLMNQPVIRSRFLQSKLFSLPNIFRENHYNTIFFHGGLNGTMFFDVFAKLVGFEFYLGFDEYPYKDDFDGSWGAFDEPYLQYVGTKLGQESRPFFASVFTLSSHNPYRVPDHFKFELEGSARPIEKSVAYADWSLKRFFESYQDEDWFKNTLFVFTADHTAELRTDEFNNTLGVYRVPIIFWHPSFELKKLPLGKMAQHVDIGPSLLHLMFTEEVQTSSRFGRNLFNPSMSEIVYNGDQNLFWYMTHPLFFYEWRKGKGVVKKNMTDDSKVQSSEFSDNSESSIVDMRAKALMYIYNYSYWHGNVANSVTK